MGKPIRATLPRKRLVLFATAASAGTLALCLISLLLLDLWAHRKFEQSAGLNRWGYRGPIVGRKAGGEYRAVALGPSTVFGYGVVWSDAFPAQLEQKLRAADTSRSHSVVNLGYNNEGAYSYRFTLRDFAYLKPDLAILYAGYSDIFGLNTNMIRRESLVFRLTGYFPLLPIVAREKIMALRYGGDLEAAYRAKNAGAVPIVFRPKSAGASAEGAPQETVSLESRPDINDPEHRKRAAAQYHDVMIQAVAAAREQGMSVLVVGQPLSGDAHAEEQRKLQEALHDRFGQTPAVAYIDLSRAVDMQNRALTFDGLHLTASGNSLVADHLLQPVLSMARRGGPGGRASDPR